MRLEFSKMHGLGNDFLVCDTFTQSYDLPSAVIRQLGDRHTGVGFDQLILLESPRLPDTVCHYRIFNADSSEVEQCGNGARCAARYLARKIQLPGKTFAMSSAAGIMVAELIDDGRVRLNMGVPGLDPEDVELVAESVGGMYFFKANPGECRFSAVSMGNPHAVITVDDIAVAPLAETGVQLQESGLFASGVNVGFMQVIDPQHIALRVLERGVGETRACGSGACAAVVAGHQQGVLADEVEVRLPGGSLMIEWEGAGNPVWMTGDAVHVYEGVLEL